MQYERNRPAVQFFYKIEIIFSCLFWVIVSSFFFFQSPFHFQTTMASVSSFFLMLFLGCFIGLCLAMPVLILERFFLKRFFGFFLLILAHSAFLILNLSFYAHYIGVDKGNRFFTNVILKTEKMLFSNQKQGSFFENQKTSDLAKGQKYVIHVSKELFDQISSEKRIRTKIDRNILFFRDHEEGDKKKELKKDAFLHFLSFQKQIFMLSNFLVNGFLGKSEEWKSYYNKTYQMSYMGKEFLVHKKKEAFVLSMQEHEKLNDIESVEFILDRLLKLPDSNVYVVSDVMKDKNQFVDLFSVLTNDNGIDPVYDYKNFFKGVQTNQKIFCRMGNDFNLHFLCLIGKSDLYYFSIKKTKTDKKREDLYSQLFVPEKRKRIFKKSESESNSSDFLNQFDIYFLDKKNEFKILNRSEKDKFMKQNADGILNFISEKNQIWTP